jgi:hypothetical protein
MTFSEQLEARLRTLLFDGPAARHLLRLRQRRPDLARELDRILASLMDAGEELLRWLRTLEPPLAGPPPEPEAA